MSGVRLVRGEGTHVVIADTYQVLLRDGALGAVLADPAGHAWSRLSLLASVDRVDAVDESFEVGPVAIFGGDGFVELSLSCSSSAWASKWTALRCYPDRLEYEVHVTGAGTLADARLLGGRAVLASGACGTFRSSVEFASVFDPTPTEPVQVVRSAATAATLGVLGDAGPGRLHGIFAPPPLCLVFGRTRADEAAPTTAPAGAWLSVSVLAPVGELRFTELRYAAEDGGFLLELDYDGHTSVASEFTTPLLVLRPVADPFDALRTYRADSLERGLAPVAGPAADWWREPIFCGWGAQCAAAASERVDIGDVAGRATDLARADRYDEWLARLQEHGIVPGTIVLDDQWETTYGSGEPHPERWPDLRRWIAARHAAGQRVLLWWKAWDASALSAEQCVVTPSGRPVAADPASPSYLAHLAHVVAQLLGMDGLDADGFKVDFLQRSPAGRSLRRPGAPADAPWGIALLHALLEALYRAAKAAKPDALLITHTPHPGFGDVTDMLRLNDLLGTALSGDAVPPVDQLRFRHAVVSAVMPDHLIDTDQWPIAWGSQWREYVAAQVSLGVPSLYYAERLHYTEHLHFAERMDRPGDELTEADLELVARAWADYRARLTRG